MQTETIINTLLSAAAFLKRPVQDVAAQSVRDIYDSLRYYLKKKLGEGSDGAKVLDLAVEKPESAMRKAVLAEEALSADLETDADLIRLVEQLIALLPATDTAAPRQNVRVGGNSNRVQVVGHDLVVHTAKHVRRCMITPDERHISDEQREAVRRVITEVAERMAVGDGPPNYAAVHQMLRRRFNVASYALIPSAQYAEALSFLRQQRAIYRSRLRRRGSLGLRKRLLSDRFRVRANAGLGQAAGLPIRHGKT